MVELLLFFVATGRGGVRVTRSRDMCSSLVNKADQRQALKTESPGSSGQSVSAILFPPSPLEKESGTPPRRVMARLASL